MTLFLIGFGIGMIVGGSLGVLLAGMLMATRDEYDRYHPWR